MDGEFTYPLGGVLASDCWVQNSKVTDIIFVLQQIRVQLGGLDLFDIELPYRHDLSVILEQMTLTDLNTPLYDLITVAMSLFDHERVRDLIFKHGFWTFKKKEVSRLLREAVMEGHLDMVRLLLPLNPNLESRKKGEMAALWVALIFDHEEIAKELIRVGVNVNETSKVPGETCDETPIHFAISKDFSDDLIDLLIQHGANIHATSKPLQTPLVYAVQSSRLYVIERLLNFGARIDFEDTDGRTLLHIACQNKRAQEVVPILLEHNIKVNAKDANGANALHYLVCYNPFDVAAGEVLLRNGISLVSKNNDGWTPLQEALRHNKKGMASLCLRYFAKFIVIDKRSCDELKDFLHYYPENKKYFEECLKEFEIMKVTEICNDIKFSCLFSKSIGELTDLVRNGDFLETYETCNIRYLFPTLRPQLENTIKMIKKNCKILKSINKELTDICN